MLEKFFPKDESKVDTEIKESIVDEPRLKGKIIKVDMERGYGFITSKEVPFTRIFFHWTSLLQDTKNFAELSKNMDVEFTKQELMDEETKQKKIRAIKIRVL